MTIDIQFADDTNIFITGKSLSEISSIINEEMILISEWIKNNRLSLNVNIPTTFESDDSKYDSKYIITVMQKTVIHDWRH